MENITYEEMLALIPEHISPYLRRTYAKNILKIEHPPTKPKPVKGEEPPKVFKPKRKFKPRIIPLTQQPDICMLAVDLNDWQEIYVYAWVRDEEWLYVGKTTKGFTRFRGHHVIGTKNNPILPDDKLLLWRFQNATDAGDFERKLILERQPTKNVLIPLPYGGYEFRN